MTLEWLKDVPVLNVEPPVTTSRAMKALAMALDDRNVPGDETRGRGIAADPGASTTPWDGTPHGVESKG